MTRRRPSPAYEHRFTRPREGGPQCAQVCRNTKPEPSDGSMIGGSSTWLAAAIANSLNLAVTVPVPVSISASPLAPPQHTAPVDRWLSWPNSGSLSAELLCGDPRAQSETGWLSSGAATMEGARLELPVYTQTVGSAATRRRLEGPSFVATLSSMAPNQIPELEFKGLVSAARIEWLEEEAHLASVQFYCYNSVLD